MRAWTGCAVPYRKADAGQECPTGYYSIVDAAACTVAAAYLSFAFPVEVRAETNDRPHGCYQFNVTKSSTGLPASHPFFNTQTGGPVNNNVQLICTSDSTTAATTTAVLTAAVMAGIGVRACLHARACLRVCVRARLHVRVCVTVFVPARACVHARGRVRACVRACVCAYVCARVCRLVCRLVCACVRVRWWVCARACACVRMHGLPERTSRSC